MRDGVIALALALVLLAAGAHAGWNLVAKRAGGGMPFVLGYQLAGVVLWALPALGQALVRSGRLSLAGVGFMAGSGVLHTGYYGALQAGYDKGELSLVYPVARGLGPLISVIAALVVLHEHASAYELAGAAVIVAAVLSLARGSLNRATAPALGLACLTGAFIAAYTVWDAHAVTALRQPVIVYFWGSQACSCLLLVAIVGARRSSPGPVWRTRRGSALAIGILSPAAYLLVLTALTLAPVVVVAPAREVSIVLGVLVGATRLGEGHARRRALAAGAILVGIALLALG